MEIKVLHIAGRSSYDGTCIYAFRLCKAMVNIDSTLLTIKKGNAEDEIKNGIKRYTSLSKKEDLNAFKHFLVLIRFIAFLLSNKYNVIHFHSGGRSFLLISFLFRRKAKFIHHFHCGNLTCLRYKNITCLSVLLFRLLKSKTIKLFVGENVLTYYETYIGTSNNNILIKNSVPYDFQRREKLTFNIGYLGQISKEKNYKELENIILQLNKGDNKLSFHIKGDSYVPERLHGSKIIYFPPSLEIAEFLTSIDILIFTSRASFEGLPLVILEALSFDTAVISYKTEAAYGLLKDYPLYVMNGENFADKINLYYSDYFDRQRLSVINQNIIKKLRYKDHLNQIQNLYEL